MVRFAGQDVQSWTPAVDIRAMEAGKVFVLGGKNYRFDSKGVKAGFGSRMLHGDSIGGQTDSQTVEIGNRTFVCNAYGIWEQRYANQFERDSIQYSTFWRQLAAFDEPAVIPFGVAKWTGAYLGSGIYLNHPTHGTFKVKHNEAVRHTPDGMPDSVLAIEEAGNRLVMLTKTAFIWSNSGNGDDLNPQTGGAGFQLLKSRLAGAPICMTKYESGVVVWSESAGLSVEFVGGEAVFRYDTVDLKLFPLGPNAVTQGPDGTNIMACRHGLVRFDGTRMSGDFVPYFNEFFRDLLRKNPKVRVRLDYIIDEDSLYVQLYDVMKYYHRTYVLALGLDKWGTFDDRHLGICRFGPERGIYGYVSLNGFAHRFMDTPDRETEQREFVGLDSQVTIGYLNDPNYLPHADTILELQELVLSARESMPPDAALEEEDWNGELGSHWYDFEVVSAADDEDWFYLRYTYESDDGEYTFSDWNYGFAYAEDYSLLSGAEDWSVMGASPEDWRLALVEIGGLPPEDWTTVTTPDEDWDSAAASTEDYSASTYTPTLPTEPDEDWDLTLLAGDPEDYQWSDGTPRPGAEDPLPPEDYQTMSLSSSSDWNMPGVVQALNDGYLLDLMWDTDQDLDDWSGPYALLNDINYGIQIESSFNGYDDDIVTVPELAIQQLGRDQWAAITSGRFQSFTLSANSRWERFHVTAFEATLVYQGHYS